jgi:hypothetical protein
MIMESEDKSLNYLTTNKVVDKKLRHKKTVSLLLIFLIAAIALGGTVYGVLYFIEYNNFRILVDRPGQGAFSLSDSSEFKNPSQALALRGPKYMDAVSLERFYARLPEFTRAEGSFIEEGMHFFAATFYIKNVSEELQTFAEAINLSESTRGMEKALRVMVVRNDEMTVYAKARADGKVEEVVPGRGFTKEGEYSSDPNSVWLTEAFSSDGQVFLRTGQTLEPSEILRYTIIVWLEGWDEECVNSILGGTLRLEFHFEKTN